MANSLIAPDRHIHAGSRWLSRRFRAAGVLMLGWLLFWTVGIIQPCCTVLADDGGRADYFSTAANAKAMAAPGVPDNDQDHCPQTLSASTPLPVEGFLLSTNLDRDSHLTVATSLEPTLPVMEPSAALGSFARHPPPRVYLRTLRLRI